MLSVVVAAIVASSALTAYLAAGWAARRQEENLKRVVHTLTDTGFPLTEPVLSKMSGLSGADFVVFDGSGEMLAATIAPHVESLTALRRLPPQSRDTTIWDQPRLELADRDYLAARLLLDDARNQESSLSLVVLYPADRRWGAHSQVILAPLVVGACAAIVVAVVVTMLARRVVQPIQTLRGRALAISAGDFQQQPLPERNDEIRDLAQSMNEMAERLVRYAEQVRQNERLRTLGQLGGGLAHQLRNFATGARMALDLHRRQCAAGPEDESLVVAGRQLKLMESYLQRFLRLGQSRPVSRVPTTWQAVVEDVVPLVQPALRHAKVNFDVSLPSAPVEIVGDSDGLQQMLINLLLNAIEAARLNDPGQRRVALQVHWSDDGQAVLAIKDSGAGPAADVEPRMFEPFVTEKPDGTGLGLSMAREIAVEHGGTLTWRREDGMTCFVVQLPTTHREEPHGAIACYR
jgi:signal transduction histidine kinase